MARPCRSSLSSALDRDAVSPSAVLAIDTVGHLERELSATNSYLADVAASRRSADSAFLVRSLGTVIATAQRLRRHVLDVISRAESTIDTHERSIRARANIVVRALRLIEQHETDVPVAAFVGRFNSVHDVCGALAERVVQVYRRWREQRETAQQGEPTMRQALTYIAIDEAEIAFERLGRDAGVSIFLHVCSASSSEVVRITCNEIAAVVGVRLRTR